MEGHVSLPDVAAQPQQRSRSPFDEGTKGTDPDVLACRSRRKLRSSAGRKPHGTLGRSEVQAEPHGLRFFCLLDEYPVIGLESAASV